MKQSNEVLRKENVRIERLTASQTSLIPKVAKTYADVFAREPWNEYTECSNTGTFFGLDTQPGQPCSCCGKPLGLAYPSDRTVKDITKELSRPDAVGLIVRDNATDEVVGFSWGFSYESPQAFVEEKYKEDSGMRETVTKLLEQEGITGKFFYLSESGILPEYRGQGLSNDFYRIRLQIAKDLGLPVVLRTNCESAMMATAESFSMRQIMGPISEIDREQKVIRRTNQYVGGVKDTEIEKRVLFVLQS